MLIITVKISFFQVIGICISYNLKNIIAQKNCYAIFRVDKSLRFFENLNRYSLIRWVEKKVLAKRDLSSYRKLQKSKSKHFFAIGLRSVP